MENTKLSSSLFAGTHFDRKRFAADFARFRKGPALPSAAATATAAPSAPSPEKKRKRKSGKAKAKKNKKKRAEDAAAASSNVVEGFSVFKGLADSNAELPSEKVDMRKDEDSVAVRQRKEIEREIERAAVLRKRFDIHIAGQNAPAPLESFEELISRYGCDSYLVGNLSKLGFQEPTPIQRQAMPILLSGRECFACAPTGSGKTLAFLFPLLMKIKPGSKGGVKAVILCPTRELAAQTVRECKKLIKGRKYYIKLMTKELSKSGNFKDMHCDILVSTPLRLDHAVKKRDLDLSSVEYLVLDESDKLFELGFVEVVDSVVEACSNPSIIRSLFSATLPDSIEALARTIMHDAIRVIVGRKNSASSLIKQKLIFAGTERGKLLALRQSFQESLNPPVLIFVQSKERAKELYKELAFDDVRVDAIHADLNEQQVRMLSTYVSFTAASRCC
ncbi:hypothetical protein BDA96_02G419300 [Sorghum bicolor]|uniref:RNA helicase n=1 Tax=Sorghum bicolor TaxID=4558 RepID=A0A921RTX6_SORBI|nr:DEAD-box ATP-dependent RNA helicase 57 isoform X2 [Sorghum bicolor]KAG0546107.1 hypothetical protein BDA96_02G419300 [Sorghum bicolor]|eukprot:XP_021308705.1 DEAD-box ATP-dependent RNA helicase 57 isoform X2 [Sorghum bicolor]